MSEKINKKQPKAKKLEKSEESKVEKSMSPAKKSNKKQK
jgi:hypothetical protein